MQSEGLGQSTGAGLDWIWWVLIGTENKSQGMREASRQLSKRIYRQKLSMEYLLYFSLEVNNTTNNFIKVFNITIMTSNDEEGAARMAQITPTSIRKMCRLQRVRSTDTFTDNGERGTNIAYA